MINPKTFNTVAQLSHFAWGALVITWAGLLFPRYLYEIWLVGELLAAIKEFWYDQHYEDVETRGSNLLDFSMYSAGAFTAYLAGYFLLKARHIL